MQHASYSSYESSYHAHNLQFYYILCSVIKVFNLFQDYVTAIYVLNFLLLTVIFLNMKNKAQLIVIVDMSKMHSLIIQSSDGTIYMQKVFLVQSVELVLHIRIREKIFLNNQNQQRRKNILEVSIYLYLEIDKPEYFCSFLNCF